MVLEEGQRGGGRVAVLKRPPVSTTVEEREEQDKKGLEKARSSLTVIKNPSLDGYLGILMAKTTMLSPDAKSFMNAYMITAYGDRISVPIPYINLAKSEQQNGNPTLYVILYPLGRYQVGSQMEHQVCKITYEEFQRFETTLRTGHGLDGLVSNMTQLIGQRVNTFSLDNGKLVLPQNYASTRL